ncbi:alpha/beta-hydrolase [Microthyrium microscopicum]|uniref:Alpha/beta-hydrolase n=1 Tax=Microthyrium microscopicum TaxID=703497 RepID=A0A6A6UAB1_9PEZI|nr:alpha/beta-hydrolase [Microthyrium microscopicum]
MVLPQAVAKGNGAPIPEKKQFGPWTARAMRLFEIIYGVIAVLVFEWTMWTGKKEFRKMNARDKKDLAAARERLWDLQKQPFGLTHKFCELRDGYKMHYMLSQPEGATAEKVGLVIFLHGYPDSWHIWHPLLKRANLTGAATLVAVDLPGFGGSDSLPTYDADTVLEVVSEFIMTMRDTYLSESPGPVVVVGHDWGALIGFRLASEASVLADRFILSNSFFPLLARANIESSLKSVAQMFKTWIHHPTNLRLLRQIYPNLKPVLRQLSKSAYVFAFKLPWPFNLILGRMGNFWFYRLCNALAYQSREPVTGAAGWDMLASCLGPSDIEYLSTSKSAHAEKRGSALVEDETYPHSIKHRTTTGGWATKICYYHDGLPTGIWTKSLQTLWELNQLEQASSSFSSASSSGSTRRRSGSRVGIFDIGPPGTLAAATTVLWGQKDAACDYAVAIEGIGDYFGVHDSHLIHLPNAGHWTTMDPQAVDVWELVIHWAVKGEGDKMMELLEGYPAAKLVFSS